MSIYDSEGNLEQGLRAPQTKTPPPTKRRILIVDDTDGVRWVLRDVISKALDVEIDEASSGFSAAKLLSQSEYAVIITDMRMPDGDGAWLHGYLKSHGVKTPLIVFSSQFRDEIPPLDESLRVVLDKSEYIELVHHLKMLGIPCRQ